MIFMINLSQFARESTEYSIWKKMRSLRRPDIYLAENIKDYRENAPNIDFPWYKKSSPHLDFMEEAYISILNVGINKLLLEGLEIPDWFVIHDESGSDVVYWNKKNYLTPALLSFEDAQENQGLRDGDHVYDIFLRYMIKKDFTSIVEVNKYKFSNKKRNRESAIERVKVFSPLLDPSF